MGWVLWARSARSQVATMTRCGTNQIWIAQVPSMLRCYFPKGRLVLSFMVGTLGMYALHGWGNKTSLLTISFMRSYPESYFFLKNMLISLAKMCMRLEILIALMIHEVTSFKLGIMYSCMYS